MYIKIDDRNETRQMAFFNDYQLQEDYDAVGSVFSLSFYFNPNNADHRFLCGVCRYQLIRVYDDNNMLMLTGFVLDFKFPKNPAVEMVSLSGYSVPGVLEESNIATSSYPLQSIGLNLREISDKLLRPFQIKFDIDPDVASLMEIPFDTTTAEPTDTVKDYLCSLASQRNIIVSHTEKGHLLYTRSKTDIKPIIELNDNTPGYSFDLGINCRNFHSPITVMKQADKDGGNASQFSINNPYVPTDTTAFRPRTIIQNSGDGNNTEQAAKNALAAELTAISFSVSCSTWYVNGVRIKPNMTIAITSPSQALYNKTIFFIRSVAYKCNNKEQTCELSLALPECYNGKPFKNIFA